jgi:maltooligosyltrehalose trehalohydrolase
VKEARNLSGDSAALIGFVPRDAICLSGLKSHRSESSGCMNFEAQSGGSETALALGAQSLTGERAQFLVWAPHCESVEVEVVNRSPQGSTLQRRDRGYFEGVLEKVPSGSEYWYILNGRKKRADPASRYQPYGVHGPSQLMDLQRFRWTDAQWKGHSLREYILYELHVGTYTSGGTFDSIIPHLGELRDLGITAVELMPVAQFPGERNWGYDGVFPFAAQNSYGGPEGLMRAVNACHEQKLSVVLDVVYNHLGPEGNYLADFGPYFTDKYRTPWGKAINFDDAHSDEVVRFFIENTLYWLELFHFDALRLDAIHGITDRNAQPFLQLLASSVHKLARKTGRNVYLIAESDFNDVRFIQPSERGGYGLDAQWNDDLHHALHVLLTGERSGYYQDFGELPQLAKALGEGYVYSGQYSSYRQRRHGNSSKEIAADHFVVFAQNHDQVGNRMLGERLSALVSFDRLKLAAAVVLLGPFIPLVFMGEEYSEDAPFNFFTSYEDPDLIQAVRQGRREEFAAFGWGGEPPDPQVEATFLASKLRHPQSQEGEHRILLEFYRELIALRNGRQALASLDKTGMEVTSFESAQTILVRRWCETEEIAIVYSFATTQGPCSLPVPAGRWKKLLDSSDAIWSGPGSSLPEVLQSTGRMDLELPANVLLVLAHEA